MRRKVITKKNDRETKHDKENKSSLHRLIMKKETKVTRDLGMIKIFAKGATYPNKDLLKKEGFSWNINLKRWEKLIIRDHLGFVVNKINSMSGVYLEIDDFW